MHLKLKKLVNAIILEAVRLKASDIHIEPFEKKIVVRYRVDGLLRKATFKIPMIYKNALISKIKIMCNMNIVKRRVPQDGGLQVNTCLWSYRFRKIFYTYSSIAESYGSY
jgi:type IV pilus assembly protein PilB